MANEINFHSLLIEYNSRFNKFDHRYDFGWIVSNSQISGKGIIARKQYNPGDIIFIDYPMVVGPRENINVQPSCVQCYTTKNLRPCSKGCLLPVCSLACENEEMHLFECIYLRKKNRNRNLNNENYSIDLIRSLTPLRCLKFDKLMKKIINNLHKLSGPQQCFEVCLLKQTIKNNLSNEEEGFMKTCCRVLNANAYEVQLPKSKNENGTNPRGLYPMASIMNHCCIPNTTHTFGEEYQMIVKASNVIFPNSEITSAYAPLLLGTPARRIFLIKSKQFYCTCFRCNDPTEFGTFLSALRCRKKTCDSMMVPVEPLNFRSSWKCIKCDLRLTSDKVAILQKVIAQQLSNLDLKIPEKIIEFIRNNKITAFTNHTIIQFKYILLKLLGYAVGYEFTELSDDLLNYKKQICHEILTIVEKLSLGQCEIKATCTFELNKTNNEIKRRRNENKR